MVGGRCESSCRAVVGLGSCNAASRDCGGVVEIGALERAAGGVRARTCKLSGATCEGSDGGVGTGGVGREVMDVGTVGKGALES